MLSRSSLIRIAPLAALLLGLPLKASDGFDSGGFPTELVTRLGLDLDPPKERIGTWLRMRGMVNAPTRHHLERLDSAGRERREEEIARVREALVRLRAAGYRCAAMLRWGKDWPSGVRSNPGWGNRAPLDLREAHARARALAEAYGDLVDAWEFDNEPDIGFFADNADVFAAFHKAVALGIAEGRAGAERAKDVFADPSSGGTPSSVSADRGDAVPPKKTTSRIVMGALALPPGPFARQLVDNGFVSYIEGANLHYYGFEEDYADAHARLRELLASAGALRGGAPSPASMDRGGGLPASKRSHFRAPAFGAAQPRRLPVFVTEWGYPRMDGRDAQTVAGRVRQWDYFRRVTLENERLGVAAPMAFYLSAYFEYHAKEFGLSMPKAERRAAHYGFVVEPDNRLPGGTPSSASADRGDAVPPETGSGSTGAEARGAFGDRAPGGTPSSASADRGDAVRPKTETGSTGAEARGAFGDRALEGTASPASADRGDAVPPKTETSVFTAGGLRFTPADFGAEAVEPWMRRIGERVGAGEASPALAWLMERAREKQAARERRESTVLGAWWAERRAGRGDWRVRAEAPSPVVIDFVPGEGAVAVKNYDAYWLAGEAASVHAREAGGALVLYNFGAGAAELRLRWPKGLRPAASAGAGRGAEELRIRLAAGERREVPVRLSVQGERFLPAELRLAAEVRMEGGARTLSRWATRLYPMPDRMAAVEPGAEARGLDFPAEAAAGNRAWLLARPQGEEEGRLERQGRWLVSPGLRVEEQAGVWRFHVEALPGVGMRPAMAELPLPDDWAPWETGLVWSYDYRVAPAAWALRRPLRADDPDPALRHQSGRAGDVIESYLRTRTGNLYSTLPRLNPGVEWASYNQSAETLTVGFPGRIAPPLRVERERPASVVFFFRPAGLPTTFEVAHPSLAPWRRAGDAR